MTVVLLGVGFLALVATHWQERQVIGRIDVRGASTLSESAVRSVVDTLMERRVDELSFADVRTFVERLPYIRQASVYMSGTRSLVVDVVEREPVAHVVIDGGELRYVDGTGAVLPGAPVRSGHNVPLVTGLDVSHERHDLKRVIGIVNAVSDIFDANLRQSISEVRRERQSGDVLILTDGLWWRVAASDVAHPEEVLRKMSVFWTTMRASLDVRSVAEFDLRWDRQVIVRYKGNGASTSA
ncbi:MAG: FtsQ-type POTRA domain-containing protein [Candidatus Kapabacteria bacterium]|nr:FtsQ-type POTRA domain-containing protein [Candidatus Kapabacteria bacterium]